ncbi:MAG: putative Histidine kinase [Thermoleophilia bacterium]|nr:putative Histidine kinase [Thermoleophilia bacterium]
MNDANIHIADVIRETAGAFDAVVFCGLALYGIMTAMRRPAGADRWFAAMFASLAFVSVVGLVVGDGTPGMWLGRIDLAVLALFPLCIYRFTRSFTRGTSVIDIASSVLTVVVVGWSLAVSVPVDRADWTAVTAAFVVVFLAHWILLCVSSGVYFLREARASQGVSARRMRLFAGASLALAFALLLAGFGQDDGTRAQAVLAAIIQLAGVVSAVLFWLAFAPPRALRASWRSREWDSMQGGVREMVAGETMEEVRESTMQAALRLTGGTGALMLDRDGEIAAIRNVDRAAAERMLAESRALDTSKHDVRRLLASDRIVVACASAAPFFGSEERRLLDTLSAFAVLAEDRASVLGRERETSERLRQLDQLKTEFVAMVAHDLRSPMSVITGFADTIHDRWTEISDEDKLEYLRLISRNTRSLADFVEDVLQVARMESGELSYKVQPFDARTVVQRIVEDMRVAHPELTLTIDAPDELPDALGDAERNWQILTNLVSNAMKFTEGDPDVRVRISTMPEEHVVAIAVRDNGVGIADEDLPRLFRRFSRVGPTRRTVAGTGLGLYIVKSMVEAQGGRIWVQSTPGEGSTFTYTLPIAGEEVVA